MRGIRFSSSVAGLILISLGFLLSQQPSPSQNLSPDMRWRMIGPFRGGRTRAAAGVPGQPSVFYVGAVNGGLWKTTDFGRTWNPIFDEQATQSIGAIAVAPSDPNIIYVASGEGLHRPDLSVGDGVYKSTDAGKTWIHLGLRNGGQIPALAIDPQNPDRLFASVLGHPYGPNQERGIFRSTDGGETWQKILYKDENTGGSDIEIDPANPAVIYASLWEVREAPWEDRKGPSAADVNEFQGRGGGLFKSTDGGHSWRALKNGLPADLTQINFTIAPTDPNRLYATVGTTVLGSYQSDKGLGFYRSDDGGETWYRATTDPRPAMRIGGGDLPVPRVDPTNSDIVYSASIVTVRSTDGGKSWTSLRGAPGGDDYQNIWINPTNPNIILLASDQGAIISVNGGETWSSWFNQPTAQLYHAVTTNDFPYRVCGAQQESGSVCIASRGNDGQITIRDWRPVGVIEYGYVAPDPLNSDIIYGGGRNEVSKFHWSSGQVENVTPIPLKTGAYRSDRTEPLVFSPVDPRVLYFAANFVFKTSDGGLSWQTISPDLTRVSPGLPPSLGTMTDKDSMAAKQRGAIYALAPSFQNANTLWAGTDDGMIWRTTNGGNNWTDITPRELTPWSKVTQISASHFDDSTAYVSVSRFRIDDMRPYIYRTRDGGKTWQSIVEGLPVNFPANTVREDAVDKGLLFAGTENAVWISFDYGDHWQSLQLNLPHTSMRDLWIHENDLIVATHGRSFWILDDISPLRHLVESIPQDKPFLFPPAAAYRIRRDTNTDTPIPPDEPAGENPPSGAILDYYLPRQFSGPVSLEILDPNDKSVRRYSSDGNPDITQAQLDKQLIPLYWIQSPKILSAEPGMHRWVWDLHYPTPFSSDLDLPIAAVPHRTPPDPLGPLALPGKYKVRLTAGAQTYSQILVVKMDPRVKATPNEIGQQFRLAMLLAPMLSDMNRALAQAHSVQDQLKAFSAAARGAVDESLKDGSLESLENKVAEIIGDPDSPKDPCLRAANADVSALYTDVQKADAPPTAALIAASEQTLQNASQALQQWTEFMTKDLPVLNRRLQPLRLPLIDPDSKPATSEPHGDED